jgi:two-component system, NtrC family, sensor kinase
LENRINERTEALNLATKKLKNAMAELKQTQQQFIQTETQKSMTSIVSGFAHEINNPLTGILGYIDLMELNDTLSDYSKKRLEGIKDQAIRIKDIVDELNWLDPEMEQVKAEIDLTNQLEKMIKIISKEKETTGIQFEKEFTEEEVIVCGNHFALWQVFEGIIENAIEAIGERNGQESKGKIRILLTKNNDTNEAVVEIIDNGGGFKDTEKVFNPFYTTKPRTEKRGIGLSIAYNVIQEHKGNISIRNCEKGAVVKVRLDCCDEEFLQHLRAENKTDATVHHKKTMSGG